MSIELWGVTLEKKITVGTENYYAEKFANDDSLSLGMLRGQRMANKMVKEDSFKENTPV